MGSARGTIHRGTAAHATSAARPALLMQRRCGCSRVAGPSGECAACAPTTVASQFGHDFSRIRVHPERDVPDALQRSPRSSSAVDEVPSIVYEVLRSPGHPLDPGTRSVMEARFGRDFSQVRVHTDERAARSAQAVNALAYTVGRDIVFESGQYVPTPAGRRLLTHELVHTIQQSPEAQPILPAARLLRVAEPTSAGEHEARRETDRIIAGHSAEPSVNSDLGGTLALQRQESPQPAEGAPRRQEQLECVKTLGGCPSYRAGGFATPEEITAYNTECRRRTGYTGDDVTPTDEDCRPQVAPEREPSGPLIPENLEELSAGEQFLVGALAGDFVDNPTFWSTIGQIVVGFIPYAGQVADVRDLIAILNRLINQGRYTDPFEWLNLVLVIVGFIPGFGDIIKGAGRGGLRWLRQSRFLGRAFRWLERELVERVITALRPIIQELVARTKRALRELLERIGERIRRLTGRGVDPDVARRAGLEARRYRTQLDQALAEAERRAAARGGTVFDNVVDPGKRSWAQADPRHRDLAYDPAHRGFTDNSIDEAQSALTAESRGVLDAPVRRDLTGGADFVDGAGRAWDRKAPRGIDLGNDVDSIVQELTNTQHWVLVDVRQLSGATERELMNRVRTQLTAAGRQDLIGRIRIVRTEITTAVRTGRVILRGAVTEEERELEQAEQER